MSLKRMLNTVYITKDPGKDRLIFPNFLPRETYYTYIKIGFCLNVFFKIPYLQYYFKTIYFLYAICRSCPRRPIPDPDF